MTPVITVSMLGALVGVVLGLTGAGGGIFAVPALVFGLGWTVAQASPVALTAVAGAAAMGSLEGLKRGLVRYKAAALMAAIGVPMTSVGARVAQSLPEWALLSSFAAAMLFVAYRLYHSSPATACERSGTAARWVPCRMNPDTGRLHWTLTTVGVLSSVGLVSGFLTGLLGVGGGFVIVPSLRQFTDITMHGIVATSLMVITIVAGGAVVNAWLHGAAVPYGIALPFVATTAAGMLIGRLLVHRVPERALQRCFAVTMGLFALSLVARAFLR